jgi:hypothetical protein
MEIELVNSALHDGEGGTRQARSHRDHHRRHPVEFTAHRLGTIELL